MCIRDSLYTAIKPEVENLASVYEKCEKVILQKTQKFVQGNEDWSEIETKTKGAVNFFFKKVNEKIFSQLLDFYAENKGTKGLKQYNEDFRVFLDDLEDYLNDLKKVHLLETPLFDVENDVKVTTKIAKVPSHILSFQSVSYTHLDVYKRQASKCSGSFSLMLSAKQLM